MAVCDAGEVVKCWPVDEDSERLTCLTSTQLVAPSADCGRTVFSLFVGAVVGAHIHQTSPSKSKRYSTHTCESVDQCCDLPPREMRYHTNQLPTSVSDGAAAAVGAPVATTTDDDDGPSVKVLHRHSHTSLTRCTFGPQCGRLRKREQPQQQQSTIARRSTC